jgi:hypothetical protein
MPQAVGEKKSAAESSIWCLLYVYLLDSEASRIVFGGHLKLDSSQTTSLDEKN